MEIGFFWATYQTVVYFSPQMVTYIFCLGCDYINSVLKSNYMITFIILTTVYCQKKVSCFQCS